MWGKAKAEALHGAELPLCVYHVRLFFVFLFRDHVDLGEVVRSLLVHEVVDPVGVQEVRAGAPGVGRALRDAVVREVVDRLLDGPAGVEVALVFVVQRVGIVLGVTRSAVRG